MTDAIRNSSPVPQTAPSPHTPHRDPGRLTTTRDAPVPLDSSSGTRKRQPFPGWRWLAVALAFPLAGFIGWKVDGRVDAVDDQFTVFGAGGALLFTLLSGLLLARFTPSSTQVA